MLHRKILFYKNLPIFSLTKKCLVGGEHSLGSLAHTVYGRLCLEDSEQKNE